MRVFNKRASFDYELTPDIAIVDPELVMSMPKGLTAYSGIDVLTHAIEAYVSVFATEFTNGYALQAMDMVFKYLKRSYDNGADDVEAKEKMQQKKLQIVPTAMYNTNSRIKLELVLGVPKRKFDKKESIKKHDIQRDMDRELSNKYK